MLRFFKSLFGKASEPTPQAPYKVELPVPAYDVAPQPEPAKCGCGRSSTGYCVGLHKLTAEEWATHPDNPAKPAVVKVSAKKKPAAKKETAAKKEPAKKKPAAITAAPRKPRAKKEAK